MTTTPPRGSGGMSPAWRELALRLRGVLAELGPQQPPCLPGEEQACGRNYAQHCINYMAALQAHAEYGLRHLCHDDPAVQKMADALLEYWREVFADDDEHCVR